MPALKMITIGCLALTLTSASVLAPPKARERDDERAIQIARVVMDRLGTAHDELMAQIESAHDEGDEERVVALEEELRRVEESIERHARSIELAEMEAHLHELLREIEELRGQGRHEEAHARLRAVDEIRGVFAEERRDEELVGLRHRLEQILGELPRAYRRGDEREIHQLEREADELRAALGREHEGEEPDGIELRRELESVSNRIEHLLRIGDHEGAREAGRHAHELRALIERRHPRESSAEMWREGEMQAYRAALLAAERALAERPDDPRIVARLEEMRRAFEWRTQEQADREAAHERDRNREHEEAWANEREWRREHEHDVEREREMEWQLARELDRELANAERERGGVEMNEVLEMVHVLTNEVRMLREEVRELHGMIRRTYREE